MGSCCKKTKKIEPDEENGSSKDAVSDQSQTPYIPKKKQEIP